MKVFRGKLESACLSINVSICQSVCVQNTTVCQSAGRGIKSHLVTALVFIALKETTLSISVLTNEPLLMESEIVRVVLL